ncbi:TPA: hypothetical protein I7784_21790 [Vibrio vulnificus]|nr:hypothetical protein [Vibrio vulnificus]
MKSKTKHIKIFDDIITLYKAYLPCYQHFPKGFRYTTGKAVYEELTSCIKIISQINYLMKEGTAELRSLFVKGMTSMQVIESYIILAWELKYLSHSKVSELKDKLTQVQKQFYGWYRWYKEKVLTYD